MNRRRLSTRIFQSFLAVFCLTPIASELQAQADSPKAPAVTLMVDFGDGLICTYSIEHKPEMTILDAMTVARARPSRPLRFSHKGSGESAFLISIDESANEGRGRTSKNWFYRVNDQLGDESFGLKELSAGDKVLWHFGKYVPK
jgi:hypothetical protein